MTITTALIIVAIATIIICEITNAIALIVHKVLIPYKRATADLSMDELLTALNAVIENEISIYERSIFEGGKRISSNAQFENYYKDIVNRILDDLSPDFFDRMSFFMKKEAVVALICRTVKTYLSNQITQ